jgi:rRNA maturation endonuclease Nob1
MGVLTAFVETLSVGEGSVSDEERFRYRCADCDATFARPKRQMTRIRCPDCGSADVRCAE